MNYLQTGKRNIHTGWKTTRSARGDVTVEAQYGGTRSEFQRTLRDGAHQREPDKDRGPDKINLGNYIFNPCLQEMLAGEYIKGCGKSCSKKFVWLCSS